MDEIKKINGLERAIRRTQPVLATIDISKWCANNLKRELNSQYTFCRLNVTKVLRATAKAVQIEAYFNTDVSVTCYCCGLQLDTEVSKASGIGPVCAKHHGVPRKSINDAPAIIAHMNELADRLGTFTIWLPKKCVKEGLDNTLKHAPAWKKPTPTMKKLEDNQIQVAEWLAKKNNHPDILTVIGRKKETEKWVLLRTTVGEIGLPKSQILAGNY